MTRIVIVGDVRDKYVRWAKTLLRRIGPRIRIDGGEEFILKRPINALVLADDRSFSKMHGASEWSNRGKLVSTDEYQSMDNLGTEEVKGYYDRLPDCQLDIGPAFWSYAYEEIRISDDVILPRYESAIIVNTEAIWNKSKGLVDFLPEIPRGHVEQTFFNIVILHEYGHQYSFGNFPPDQMLSIRGKIDLNLAEGFASIFAHGMSSPNERYVLAEYCLRQPLPYHFYLVLKPYDLTGIFRSFITKAEYYSGLTEFIGITGVRIKMSSGGIYSKSFIQGAPIMDSSDSGGVIVAGERIERIVPLPSGYIITPLIENLLGRCPTTTRIFANEISRHDDYGILPGHVVIIPPSILDLQELISSCFDEEPNVRLRKILKGIRDAGFSIC